MGGARGSLGGIQAPYGLSITPRPCWVSPLELNASRSRRAQAGMATTDCVRSVGSCCTSALRGTGGSEGGCCGRNIERGHLWWD